MDINWLDWIFGFGIYDDLAYILRNHALFYGCHTNARIAQRFWILARYLTVIKTHVGVESIP